MVIIIILFTFLPGIQETESPHNCNLRTRTKKENTLDTIKQIQYPIASIYFYIYTYIIGTIYYNPFILLLIFTMMMIISHSELIIPHWVYPRILQEYLWL